MKKSVLKNSFCCSFFLFCFFQTSFIHGQGTWTPVTALAPHTNGGEMMLLSDGSIICKTFSGTTDGIGNIWDKLTPNANGSYANGTWSQIAPMNRTRLYFSSQTLMDGRIYVAGGEYGTGTSRAEIYNPVTNIWTNLPNPGHIFSDANSEILPNGTILNAIVEGSLMDNLIYDPQSNTFSNGPSCLGIHNESAWMKLPDNSVLMVDRLSTNSERYIPASNQWIADATVPVNLYDPYGDETGGALLLPNGKAFFIGSPSNTAIYTPSGTTSPGTWAAGPNVPGGNGATDAPMAMMVDGNVLLTVAPEPFSPSDIFNSPTSFFVYNYLSNSFIQINAPSGGLTINEPCYTTSMLDLPDGKVLFASMDSDRYYVFTPSGAPLTAGKPTIGVITQTNCDTFNITGTLFNGISQGATYGDDWQNYTNFPIVRLTNGPLVYYCRTFNWNSTSVMTGNAPSSASFKLPVGLPPGTYQLYVVANGIASTPVTFIPCFPVGIDADEDLKNKLAVYPDPASEKFTIELQGENFGFIITDITGKKVMEQNNIINRSEIECSEMQNGVYFILAKDEQNNCYNKRVVISK